MTTHVVRLKLFRLKAEGVRLQSSAFSLPTWVVTILIKVVEVKNEIS